MSASNIPCDVIYECFKMVGFRLKFVFWILSLFFSFSLNVIELFDSSTNRNDLQFSIKGNE